MFLTLIFGICSSRKIKIILTHQVFVNKFLGLYVLNSAQPLYPTVAKIIPILQAVSSATTTTHHLMNEEELLKASNLDLSHHHLVRLLLTSYSTTVLSAKY